MSRGTGRTGGDARSTAEVARAARQVCRERSAGKVRPAWWVFSVSPIDAGSWVRVLTTTAFVVDDREWTRLTVVDPATGRRYEIDSVSGWPASCCTPAEARRAGLV
jgi:hypothetical protein